MIVIFIAAFFCVLNICLWCTFFIKFRKLFSTEDIISSTHEQVDEMIKELNYNASRNIDLIEDRIKKSKAAIAELDKHLDVVKKEIEEQKASFSYYKKIEAAPFPQSRPKDAANRYLQNQAPSHVYSDISAGLKAENSYELTGDGKNHVSAENNKMQASDLFESSGQIVSNTGTTFTVENDGSSYTNVPVIGGNVRYADEQIKPKKSFSQMVRELNSIGRSVEEIASELHSSTTEVQLVLNML